MKEELDPMFLEGSFFPIKSHGHGKVRRQRSIVESGTQARAMTNESPSIARTCVTNGLPNIQRARYHPRGHKTLQGVNKVHGTHNEQYPVIDTPGSFPKDMLNNIRRSQERRYGSNFGYDGKDLLLRLRKRRRVPRTYHDTLQHLVLARRNLFAFGLLETATEVRQGGQESSRRSRYDQSRLSGDFFVEWSVGSSRNTFSQ